MKKQILILTIIIALLLIVSIFVIILANGVLIGRVIGDNNLENNREFDYTWTTAICDGNKCRDFEIACLDGEAIRMDPVSGMVVFPDDWVDGRKDRELCEK